MHNKGCDDLAPLIRVSMQPRPESSVQQFGHQTQFRANATGLRVNHGIDNQ